MLSLAVAGCATTPAARVDRIAAELGLVRQVVQGRRYAHVVYGDGTSASGTALHIYIEGDGSPYVDRQVVARDPTPKDPVMLRLMALDDAPRAYLGRPCYFGLNRAASCSPIDWTIGRFSDDVVSSMAAAAERLRVERGAGGLVLIGHSGGGTLAVLLAQRLPDVEAVVTIAGNLDPSAWTELHGYAPLGASLDPMASTLSVPTVLHLAGADDRVTPPELVRDAARRLGPSRVVVVDDASHACCWEEPFRAVLERLR